MTETFEVDFQDEEEKQNFVKQIEERNKVQIISNKQQKRVQGKSFPPIINKQTVANCNLTLPLVYTKILQMAIQLSQVTARQFFSKEMSQQSKTFNKKKNRFNNVTALHVVQEKKDQGKKIIHFAVGESSKDNSSPYIVVTSSCPNAKWYVIPVQEKGIIKQIQINTERAICLALMQNISTNQLVFYYWLYKKEKLLLCNPIRNTQLTQNLRFSLHPIKQYNFILTGNNHLKLWDLLVRENVIQQNPQQLIKPQIEKENLFIDHCWIYNLSHPILVVLSLHQNKNSNYIFIFQDDSFKKQFEIDVSNLNIQEVNIFQDIREEEVKTGGVEDVYNVLNAMNEDYTKEKSTPKKSQFGPKNFLFQSISASRKGFAMGGSEGCMSIFELEKNFAVVPTQNYQMKDQQNTKIVDISCSSNESVISMTQINAQGILNYYILNAYQTDGEASPIIPFMPAGFHTNKINSITVSVAKQIFATCSQDNTVKIWSYYESDQFEKRGIMSQSFKNEPLCVALHPSGFFLAVCFAGSFQVYNLLTFDMKLLYEESTNFSNVVRYSVGGDLLIVNSRNQVFIYEAIFYNRIHIMECMGGQIKDLIFAHDDNHILASCMTGHIICWNFRKQKGATSKSVVMASHVEHEIYNALDFCLYPNNDQKLPRVLLIGSTKDKYMSIYKEDQDVEITTTKWEQIADFPVIDTEITAICICDALKCVFYGTNQGNIRVSVWPILENNMELQCADQNSNKVMFKIPDFLEIKVHNSAITCLQLTYDNQYLLTSDMKGGLFLLKIKDAFYMGEQLDIVKPLTEEKRSSRQIRNDIFFTSTHKITKLNIVRNKMQQDVFQLQSDKIKQMQDIDRKFNFKVQGIEKDFAVNLQGDQRTQEQFVKKSEQDYEKIKAQYEQEIKNSVTEKEKLNKQHQDKINYEIMRNQEVRDKMEQHRERHAEEVKKLHKKHEDSMKVLKQDYYHSCREIQFKYSNAIESSKNFGKSFLDQLHTTEEKYAKDIDVEIKGLKDNIQVIKQDNLISDKKNAELTSKYDKLKKEDETLQKEFEEQFKKHNQIRYMNLKNDEDILKMQHQLLERLQVIDSKEETCKQAKDEEINLENFRYILEEKIQLLQKEKSQLMEKINFKEKNLKQMFQELITSTQKNEVDYQTLLQLNDENRILSDCIQNAEERTTMNLQQLVLFQQELASLVNSNENVTFVGQKLYDLIDDENDLKMDPQDQKSQQMQIVDSTEASSTGAEKQEDVGDELIKQGKWLTKKLYLIKETSKKLKRIRDDNINSILNQNTKLIEECNLLRNENERRKKEIKKVNKLLAEAWRKRDKLRKQQHNNAVPFPHDSVNSLMEKYTKNTNKLAEQEQKIHSMQDSIQLLVNQSQSHEQSQLNPITYNFSEETNLLNNNTLKENYPTDIVEEDEQDDKELGTDNIVQMNSIQIIK